MVSPYAVTINKPEDTKMQNQLSLFHKLSSSTGAIVARTTKNATSKKHPKSFYES